MEGKEKSKKNSDHSRLVGDGINKQGNLQRRHELGDLKIRRSLHPPTRISLSFIQSFDWAQSHQSHCPDGPNNTLFSQGCVLENNSHCRNESRFYRQRSGVKSPQLLRSSSRINGQSHPFDDNFNIPVNQHNLVFLKENINNAMET